ncbi:hypothetical protein BJX63DRAFT_320804 [Aspergillus granulosus]|uniref:Uncharacterized protein n=1 Tax=Aspergillus granulosus TaxID=176169 RepID=A0ABR4H4B9_9EURO
MLLDIGTQHVIFLNNIEQVLEDVANDQYEVFRAHQKPTHRATYGATQTCRPTLNLS